MDGFEAVRLLREVPEVRDVPVIACTAHDTRSHCVQARGWLQRLPSETHRLHTVGLHVGAIP